MVLIQNLFSGEGCYIYCGQQRLWNCSLGNSMFHFTPIREELRAVWCDFISTLCLRSLKGDLNKSSYSPQIPQKCNSANKISWFTQSEAFARPQKIPSSCISWLIDLNVLSVSLKATSSVDILFLKPYCSVTGMLLVCRCWLNLKCIASSSNLKKTVNNGIDLEGKLSFYENMPSECHFLFSYVY